MRYLPLVLVVLLGCGEKTRSVDIVERAPDQEAPEPTPTPTPGPVPTPTPPPVVTPPPRSTNPSYVEISVIISRSCLGTDCHSKPRPADGLPLDGEFELHDEFDDVVEAIETGFMPIHGRPPVSKEELDLLKLWYRTTTPPEKKDKRGRGNGKSDDLGFPN